GPPGNGMPLGMSTGVPNGMSTGMPTGMSHGMPNGVYGGPSAPTAAPPQPRPPQAALNIRLETPHFANIGQGGSAFPTMEELSRNAAVGHSGQTISDNEVKVKDSTGRELAQFDCFATFDACPFPPPILAALKKAGFPAPSQIQQYTWPLALKGLDVIGVAATGSGKTLSFLLPGFATMLERQVSAGDPSLLCIAPTRELAVQIQEEADKFGLAAGIKTVCCYGGAPKGPQ
ncbi:unnamed protein product, partial [Polarella glacialis]